MKFKYYLRGIGIGIIFASIIFLIAYRENIPSKMSNDEIIERAKQLGMVEANDPINKLLDKNSAEISEDKVSDNNDKASEIQVTSEITTEQLTEAEKVTTTEAVTNTTTETESEKTTEAKTEDKKTEEKDNIDKKSEEKTDNNKIEDSKITDDKNSIEITVDRGSSSYPVCQKLEELGMIDDAAKFDDYLVENGYANRISVGTHKLTKGMDYHTIAELISDPLD